MSNTTFPVMDGVIQVWAVPEFVHQNCVKFIGYWGDPKHNCAARPLSILNTGSIKTFLPASLNTCLKWKINKMFKEVNEAINNFFPTNVCFLMSSIKWRWKGENLFLLQNFLCENVCMYFRGHLFYFRFTETY